jgi:HSP90 family molecular chaperone
MISLDQYVESMPENQNAIYYIATDSLQSAKTAPFLEKLVQKDIEVWTSNNDTSTVAHCFFDCCDSRCCLFLGTLPN